MPGFQGFYFAKQGEFMKVLRGFVLCLYCLMLAITGVSFLMGSTCKAAISDIVVYKSEDKITDAIASVYPNLKGDELDKVFDYLENDKDLRKIADMYVDAAIKVASSNKNKDKTLEEMLSETQTSEMNNAVSSFTDNLVNKVFGDEANNISGIAATLYNAVKQSVSLKVTEAVSYYTAGVVDGMSTKQRMIIKIYAMFTSVAAHVVCIIFTVINALLIFAAYKEKAGVIRGLGLGTTAGGLVLFILSKMFVNVGMRLSNRMVGRTVDFSMNGWYLFSGICVAAGVVMIVVAQVIKKNNN